MRTNQKWLLKSRPVGLFKESDFEWREEPVADLKDGEVLVRQVLLSLDPTNKVWATQDSYLPAVPLGDVMRGFGIGVVEESRNAGFAAGDVVQGMFNWQLYAVSNGAGLNTLPKGVPLSLFMGVLGPIGITAYFGLLEIGQPKAGETVVVAAASGPVGATVGQLARIYGARAVGIAGGQEKVEYVRSLGFDAALDHRSPTFNADLAAATPDGIDVYFENVGGHVWEAVFPRLNQFARVPVCGLVSSYNATSLPEGPDKTTLLLTAILRKRLTVRGFIVSDFASLEPQFLRQAAEWVRDGSLRCREDIVDGLENAPAAFIGMLDGRNFGKLLVRV